MVKSGRSSSKRKSGRSANRQVRPALGHSQSDRTVDTVGGHSGSSRLYPCQGNGSETGETESPGHAYPDTTSPIRERQQHRFLERQMSDHQIGDITRGTSEGFAPGHLRRRRSIDSYRSRSGSDNPNLANIISHYMHGIDAEGSTGMMAARYYGNMAQIPEDADRLPRPMNSTLPLVSLSVMNGGRNLRTQSPHDSDESSQRRQSRFIRTRADTEGALLGLSSVSVPVTSVDQSILLDANQSLPVAEGPFAEATRRQLDSGDIAAVTPKDRAPIDMAPEQASNNSVLAIQAPATGGVAEVCSSIHTPTRPEIVAEPSSAEFAHPVADLTGIQALPPDMLSYLMPPRPDALPAAGLEEQKPDMSTPSFMAAPTAASSSMRRLSLGSCAFVESSERMDGLGVRTDSRQSSQAHSSSRKQQMGAIQYKPAATTKKTAIARGAPGLSYMFSPTISASRPSSVIGMTAPPTPMLPPRGAVAEGHHSMLQLPVSGSPKSVPPPEESQLHIARLQCESGEATAGTNNTGSGMFIHKAERKKYGSINIGALEQFLEEGEVPDSTSDDDSCDDNDAGWEEDYPGSSPRSRTSSTGQSTCSSTRDRLAHNSMTPARLAAQQPLQNSRQQSPRQSLPGIYESIGNNGGVRTTGSMSYRQSPRVRSIGRSSMPDERMPLLMHSAVTIEPPLYSTDPPEFVIPADVPNIDEIGSRREYSSPRDPGQLPKDASGRRRGKGRGRGRNRKHHEELFLDKDGFIDESYRFTFFNPAVGTIRAQEFADLRTPGMDLAALLQVGGCFWIDVLLPSFHEMHLFSKIFGIHALTVEDIMTQDAREKCEIHANYYFVCFRSFDNDPNSEAYLEPKCIYNVVLREGIITFHMDPAVHQYHVLRRIRRQIDHIVVTPDWLNYAIIDDITDLLAPILQIIEFDVDAIDELVLVISSSEQSDMLLRISTVRKRIMMVMRLLQGKADVVRALTKRFETATAMSMNAFAGTQGIAAERIVANRTSPIWDQDSQPRRTNSSEQAWIAPAEMALDQRKGQETLLYLGDVLDHIVTMMQNAAHYDNILGRAHANYLAQISIELTESSNRTNDVVAKLSALAAIVVPLNFITGMWGANVKVPGQEYDDLHYFFCILGMCLLYVIVAIAWARYYKIF
ncbi:CorA metal ion transporter [Coemansia sp. RSA 922]|nr:CorA metal ion transporter [Coemansia sp. S3946]KAJ2052349.1 CorA metal ion transporter [Coemansia sp. S16]KAJ2112902.1 CorA metal ion transporter [Coemansia sp. RSA 922]